MPRRLDYASRTTPRPRAPDTVLKFIAVVATMMTALFILAVFYSGRVPTDERAKFKARTNAPSNLASTLERFGRDCGRYPSREDGLAALWNTSSAAAGWNGPYAKGPVVRDELYGSPLRYEPLADGGVRLTCAGADEAWGTPDDITVDVPPPPKASPDAPTSSPADDRR